MHVDVREAGKAIIVELDGRLVAGSGDELLREVMNELVSGGWKQIVLDLSGVARIDSAGIGELVAGYRMAQRFGSEVRLLHVAERNRRVLELSQVVTLLGVYESEEEALASFRGAAESDGDAAEGDEAGGDAAEAVT